jgi:serine protease inhibitor
LLRPVTLTGSGVNSGKVFNYDPFPLYLVAKLKDNSQINNITVKETVGNFQRTVTPKWYTYNNVSIELYGGKADNAATSPTNFSEINRLSSALIDTQNNCQLRPSSVTRDTIYVGANDTTTINMSKVFGVDRRVITPDINNTEATFIVARKINAGSGSIETSLNFKEQ